MNTLYKIHLLQHYFKQEKHEPILSLPKGGYEINHGTSIAHSSAAIKMLMFGECKLSPGGAVHADFCKTQAMLMTKSISKHLPSIKVVPEISFPPHPHRATHPDFQGDQYNLQYVHTFQKNIFY